MHKFNEWLQIREVGVGHIPQPGYTEEDFDREVAEDAELGYNQIVKMSDPMQVGKFQWYHYNPGQLAANKNQLIQAAIEKITSSMTIGGSRAKGRTIAKNYILAQLQKGPISRKTAEFGKSIGYTPTVSLSPPPGYNTQYVGLGVQKPARRGPGSKFRVG